MSTSIRQTSRLAVLLTVAALAIGLMATAADASKSTVLTLDEPFTTVVPTAYADNPAGVELMFAECNNLKRVEHADGTAVETIHCELTDPFFVFSGTPPETTFRDKNGACIWWSDYHANTSGAEVYADKIRVVVTPSGNVFAQSTYPAEPLDC